jgi:hypothetical protein
MIRRAALCALLLALAPAATRAAEPAAPTLVFLEGDAAKKAIADDAAEPYFSLLQPIEMAAKMKRAPEGADLAALREDCRKHYQDAVVPVTEEERKAVTALIQKVHGAWGTDYPLLAKTPWSIVPVSNKVEAGIPHTRGEHVVLPQELLSDMVRAAKDLAGPDALFFCGLLAREQAKVMQRKDPAAFAALYASWGFVHAKAVASHPGLDRLRWTNPDGTDVTWVFPVKEKDGTTTFVQPLTLFAEGDEPRRIPDDVRMGAVTLEKDGEGFRPKLEGDKPVFRDLSAIPEYGAVWGGIEETFHPNEIFAALFSAMVLRDRLRGPDLDPPASVAGKDFATLRAWCKERFSGKASTPPK